MSFFYVENCSFQHNHLLPTTVETIMKNNHGIIVGLMVCCPTPPAGLATIQPVRSTHQQHWSMPHSGTTQSQFSIDTRGVILTYVTRPCRLPGAHFIFRLDRDVHGSRGFRPEFPGVLCFSVSCKTGERYASLVLVNPQDYYRRYYTIL